MIAAIATDRGAGVDPLSLVIGYKQTLLLAALYDPVSGLVLWPLSGAPKIGVGRTPMLAIASDYQESKNVDQAGGTCFRTRSFRTIRAARGRRADRDVAAAEGRAPASGKASGLFVTAGASRGVRSVTFFDGQAPDRDRRSRASKGSTRRRGAPRKARPRPPRPARAS